MILFHIINNFKLNTCINYNIIMYDQNLTIKYKTLILEYYRYKNTKKKLLIFNSLYPIYFFCVYSILINSNYNSTNKNNKTTKNVASYVINTRFKGTNILISSATIEGKLRMSTSAGLMGLRGKQRKNKTHVLLLMLKRAFDNKAEYIKKVPVVIHFKNIKSRNIIKSAIFELKRPIFINAIKSYDLKPHNGCRGRKLRRKK